MSATATGNATVIARFFTAVVLILSPHFAMAESSTTSSSEFGQSAQQASSQLAGAAAWGGLSCVSMMNAAANAPPEDQALYMALMSATCAQAQQYSQAQKKNEAITEQIKAPEVQKLELQPPPTAATTAEESASSSTGSEEALGASSQEPSLSPLTSNPITVATLSIPDLTSLQSPNTTPQTQAKAPEEASAAPAEIPTSIPGLIDQSNVSNDDTTKGVFSTSAETSSTGGFAGGAPPANGKATDTQDRSPAQYAAEGDRKRGGIEATSAGTGSGAGGGSEGGAKERDSGDDILAKLLGQFGEPPPLEASGAGGPIVASEDVPKGQFDNIFQFASYRYGKLVKDKRVGITKGQRVRVAKSK